MTANEIKKSALVLFIEKGYDGTSLAEIGEEVGIKKQSIYSHFKNKDDLFLQVMKEVIQEEISFMNDFFSKHENHSLYDILYNFIIHLKDRYISEGEMNIKFLLRMMFIPPNHLQEIVISNAFTYYNKLEKLLEEVFSSHENDLIIKAEDGTISFLNFIDGLLVELIYVNVEKFEKRLTVSWDIYWRGIKK